jgi:transposase
MAWRQGQAYSQDLRDRVFNASDTGMAVGMIATALMVSVSYVSKTLTRRRQTGETAARAQRCHVPGKLDGHHDSLRTRVAAHPDETLEQLKQWVATELGVTASRSLLSKTLNALHLTYKKRPSTPPNRTVPMSPGHERIGARTSQRSIPDG